MEIFYVQHDRSERIVNIMVHDQAGRDFNVCCFPSMKDCLQAFGWKNGSQPGYSVRGIRIEPDSY